MKSMNTAKSALLKWTALFALVFAFALTVCGTNGKAAGTTYRVKVSSGYLALRNAKAFERENELGELYTGDTMEITDTSDSTYWFGYSPKLDMYGYVNKNYLESIGTSASGSWTVRVSSGYLALRNAKAYDASNEVGKLYTGDTVDVMDASDSTYWYVYAPSLDKLGYVNKNYIFSTSTASTWTVSVTSGYLALRNAKAYDASNEIGKLYTGDTVQVSDTSDSTYWYVYAPSLGKYGYVNKDYLYGGSTPDLSSYPTWIVRVSSGYLALRNAKAYDASNEIGKLYTGDTVKVTDSSDSAYWYVYAPSLGKYGYVNKDYLY